ncbi:unnamed protein product [Rotaria sp. Silwood1]|nr:unnamed protein product [Rotaria sp. Silwood1]CAF3422987.1 unnamed protein product [Rotaria sp. Silwood1]CAF3460728.1 unnamed protein product [Rotaria sp. Silwood1]CAF4524058.1 unnamed protein product [Rotaria sp. Silwood1]CAF4639548.1 unnamed protein product [Rotaria sp. Silwood1]
MSKHRQGGRQNRSYGGTAGGRGGGRGGGNKQGKILYNAGDEPAFIRQFKERTGYQAPSTTDDKRRILINEINDNDEQPRDGDYRKDDEKPQIVQLNTNDLSKEEVEIELAKAKEAEEEKKCIDSNGRLLFRKPKEKSDESASTTSKSDIVEMASNKSTKRKNPIPSTTTTQKESNHGNSNETKKTKIQLLSFMNESGIDGDD